MIFIRHAQTENNQKEIFQGVSNAPILETETPRIQQLAFSLKKKFALQKHLLLFYSPLERARQTAFLLDDFLGLKSQLTEDDRLTEINFGIFDGLTKDAILKNFGKEYQEWKKDQYSKKIPTGESFGIVKERIWSFFKEFRDEPDALAVTHGTAMKILYAELRKKTLNQEPFFPPLSFFSTTDSRLHIFNPAGENKRIH